MEVPPYGIDVTDECFDAPHLSPESTTGDRADVDAAKKVFDREKAVFSSGGDSQVECPHERGDLGSADCRVE